MAFCSSCGTPIDENEEYCSSCKIEQLRKTSEISNSANYSAPAKNTGNILWPIASIVLALVLVAESFILIKNFHSTDPSTPSTPSVTTTTVIGVISDADKKLIIAEDKIINLEKEIEILQKDLEASKENNSTASKELEAAVKELDNFKNNTILKLENDLYDMRHPKSFKSEVELTDYLYENGTYYTYRDLSAIDRGYILYTRIIRSGYFASFMIENVNNSEMIGYVYVYVDGVGIYKINPINNNIILQRSNISLDKFYQETDNYNYSVFKPTK